MLFDKETCELMHGKAAAQTDKLRIVPCTTAAGSRVLLGIEIDRVALEGGVGEIKAVVCIAQHPLAEGCGALVGNTIIDELKGVRNEKIFDGQNRGVGAGPAKDCGKPRLYQRQRSASAAADPAGGDDAAHAAR